MDNADRLAVYVSFGNVGRVENPLPVDLVLHFQVGKQFVERFRAHAVVLRDLRGRHRTFAGEYYFEVCPVDVWGAVGGTISATLTVALYVYASERGETAVAFAIATILMVLTFIINFAANLAAKKLKKV